AISFVSRRIGRTRIVFLTGLLYTLGRILAYVALGILLVESILSTPQLSHLLQKYMNKILGPILILVGMILLDLLRFSLPGAGLSEKMQKRFESWGIWGAGLLGVIFALSFCPISAALFFGSLIPLSVKSGSGLMLPALYGLGGLMLPALYGLGTGLPVLLFAVLIAFGAQSVGNAFNKLTQLELWIRRVTGGIFILVGVYYCLMHIFNIFT
ncbi:MAG: urease accessory protein UreH domain-containing protein, partial [Planctomycetota bacterium]